MIAEVDWVIVPSIWWENSPLVIQEAFATGRPVICSEVGALAKKSPRRQRAPLPGRRSQQPRATIRRAVGTPGLWEQLREGHPASPLDGRPHGNPHLGLRVPPT